MRAPFPLVLLALLLAACDAADDGPVVGGVYQSVATGDPSTGSTAIDLDVPPTRSGAFVLGDRSAFEATAASSSDRVALSGTGEVAGTTVTVTLDELPAVFVTGDGVAVRFLGSDQVTLTGTVTADGAAIVFGSGAGEARYERR